MYNNNNIPICTQTDTHLCLRVLQFLFLLFDLHLKHLLHLCLHLLHLHHMLPPLLLHLGQGAPGRTHMRPLTHSLLPGTINTHTCTDMHTNIHIYVNTQLEQFPIIKDPFLELSQVQSLTLPYQYSINVTAIVLTF